jgi:hypothetical protein
MRSLVARLLAVKYSSQVAEDVTQVSGVVNAKKTQLKTGEVSGKSGLQPVLG